MLFVALTSLFLVFSSDSAYADPLKAKPGEDVLLQSRAPSGTIIRLLEWIRPDLQDDGNVFFYRNNRAYEKYQHPWFHGRVELRDPQMKDGDTSLILKNVNIKDTGTYNCRIIVTIVEGEKSGTEFTSITNLTVTESLAGFGGEDTQEMGKTEEVIQNGEHGGGNVKMVVGLSVFAVVCLIVGMLITTRKCVKEIYHRPGNRTGA